MPHRATRTCNDWKNREEVCELQVSMPHRATRTCNTVLWKPLGTGVEWKVFGNLSCFPVKMMKSKKETF